MLNRFYISVMAALSITLFIAALKGLASKQEGLVGVVISVYDGDTIKVVSGADDKELRVRLSCIDAPEMSQRPYGALSRDNLRRLLPIGSTATIALKAQDRYGRIVGEVFNEGVNVNLQQVTDGQAYVYTQYLSLCDRAEYLKQEAIAKDSKLGVWTGNLMPPWEYRRR